MAKIAVEILVEHKALGDLLLILNPLAIEVRGIVVDTAPPPPKLARGLHLNNGAAERLADVISRQHTGAERKVALIDVIGVEFLPGRGNFTAKDLRSFLVLKRVGTKGRPLSNLIQRLKAKGLVSSASRGVYSSNIEKEV